MKNTKQDPSAQASSYLPQTGIDVLLKDPTQLETLKGKRVALLSNQSALTVDFIPTAYALHNFLGDGLIYLLSPEHGWSAFCAAGEEIEDIHEPHTGLPVLSLFGPLFEKNLPLLQTIDTLIVDIQDVGVRCYTYAATCAKILEYVSSKNYALEIIICDRPNPLGKTSQGPSLLREYRSIIGYIDVPYQHGKTLGELLSSHNKSLDNPVSLSIITNPVSSYSLEKHFWIPPSPGLPDWETVFLYPGLVLLEGTNVSEGRGSSLPFKCVAAPHLNFMKLMRCLNQLPHKNITARPFSFIPSFEKLRGQLCQGVQLHLADYKQVNGLYLGITILSHLATEYSLFEWKQENGQYEIDKLTGSPQLRQDIERGKTTEEIMKGFI